MTQESHSFADCALELGIAGIEETAALYAAGSLTIAETLAFNARLSSGCRLCHAALQQANTGVIALSLSVPEYEPDPGLEARLLGSLGPQLPRKQAVLSRFPDAEEWQDSGVSGITEKILFNDPVSGLQTCLVRMEPGACFPSHFHSKTEQCLVLEGEVYWGSQRYGKGDFVIGLAGQQLPEISTRDGNILLMIGSSDAQFSGSKY